MGCDIHEYVEIVYLVKPGEDATDQDQERVDFIGRIELGRDYTLFALLAGVRNYDNLPPVSEPKGWPTNASWRSSSDYCLNVYPDDHKYAGLEHCCSMTNALKWLAEKSSILVKGTLVKPEKISGPDWHSASWLTTDELKEVTRRYRALPINPQWGIEKREPYIGFDALIALMEVLDRKGKARLVFFFDN